MMMAKTCDLGLGELVLTFGDVHLYNNHQAQAQLQLTRTPGKLPSLNIKEKRSSVLDYVYDDFELLDYFPQPAIPAPVAV